MSKKLRKRDVPETVQLLIDTAKIEAKVDPEFFTYRYVQRVTVGQILKQLHALGEQAKQLKAYPLRALYEVATFATSELNKILQSKPDEVAAFSKKVAVWPINWSPYPYAQEYNQKVLDTLRLGVAALLPSDKLLTKQSGAKYLVLRYVEQIYLLRQHYNDLAELKVVKDRFGPQAASLLPTLTPMPEIFSLPSGSDLIKKSLALRELDGSTWKEWLEVIHALLFVDYGGHPEKNKAVYDIGRYKEAHKNPKSEKAKIGNVLDGVKERMRQALQNLLGLRRKNSPAKKAS